MMGLTKQPSLSMTTSSVRKEREIFPTILQIISYSGIVSSTYFAYTISYIISVFFTMKAGAEILSSLVQLGGLWSDQ